MYLHIFYNSLNFWYFFPRNLPSEWFLSLVAKQRQSMVKIKRSLQKDLKKNCFKMEESLPSEKLAQSAVWSKWQTV